MNGLEIAIIGLAGRFPGAGNPDQFWQNLRDGVESISLYSDEDMLAAGTDKALLSAPNFVNAGGVLEDIELFDASFFGYSPREAEIIDPQQRILLECAWEALEHAGYDSESYPGSIGIYAGGGMSSYLLNIFSNPQFAATADSLQLANGNDKDHLTTRVAYKLNLTGPGVTVQSSCSTSLVAIHTACQGLLSGACDIALSGGVSLSLPQKGGYLYQEGGIMSADGHCRAFDAAATGTVGGSGMGIVVLKRLQDALEDGDCIHAVIKGSAVNNDGSLKIGYTAPSVEGQARVIRAAQMMAEVEPETITYIEAHGTATSLGDPIEIAALTKAFRARTQKKSFCAVGSVKTNIGHTDAAAGVAGVIKTVLALSHKMIPPSLHFTEPNPQIDFADSPFYVNAKLSEWTVNGHPRRAGVSSFGMGGTNAHAVLEEAPPVEESGTSRTSQLLVLSAKTETALEAMTSNLAHALKRNPEINLADVAFTLQLGRRALNHRRILVCTSTDDAVNALEQRHPKRVLTRADEAGERPVVFMFPGQGAQYVTMGLELYREEQTFREQVDLCSELLKPHLGIDLRDLLYPSEQKIDEATQKLTQTSITQPALFVVEYALGKLWQEWGVRPQAMIGHSVGEYVAACFAGVFSLEDALMLIARRGRLMQSLPAGAMLAVQLPESEVLSLLRDTQLSLASVNSSSQCVVSGLPCAVEELSSHLNAREVSHRLLHTSHAFHSEMMEPILGPFKSLFEGVKLRPPTIPYLSNLTGNWVTDEEATSPEYWTSHLRHTVRFSDGLRELFKQPNRILLEVGPGETLSTLVKRHPEKPVGQNLLHSLSHRDKLLPDLALMLNSLGQLWLARAARIDWTGFHAHHRRRRVPLPAYPFERQRFWVERQPLAGITFAHQVSLDKKQDIADWFYVPLWKQSVAPHLLTNDDGGEEITDWLLFNDDCGVGSSLARRLRSEGGNVVIVTAGEQFTKRGEGEYSINPERHEDYVALLDELHALGKSPRRIVSLWSIGREESNPLEAEDVIEDLQNKGFYSLLFLAQALGERLLLSALDGDASLHNLRICVVSNNMQKVFDDEQIVPEKALILGACRVIHQEYPNVTCQSIDIASPSGSVALEGEATPLINQLLAEIKGTTRDIITAYRGQQRWVQTFDQIHLPAQPGRPARLREQGVYLITGGLGGIALEVSEYLARSVRAKLILLGRSSFPAREQWNQWLADHDEEDAVSRKIRKIQSLEGHGAEVLILHADVANLEQTGAALALAYEQFGTDVHGVFHLAGTPPTSLIQRKTKEMAASVLAAKVSGTRVLQKLFKQKRLDFLILFSSLRSLTGGPGTFDYTAANAFLDAFASNYHSPEGTPVMAIDWDGWRELGMSLNVQVRAEFSGREGDAGSMTTTEGMEAFDRLMRYDLPQVAVSTCDLQSVIEQEQSFDAAEALKELEKPHTNRHTYSRPHIETSYVAPRSRAEETLAAIWQELLGIEKIGVEDNFFELGGDSVISILIIAKARQAGLNLTPKQVFEHQTISELAAACDLGLAAVAEQGTVTGVVPLTPIQHWFFEQNLSNQHHHNQAVMLETRESIDASSMEEAVRALLLHHDALRLRFKLGADGWEQFNVAPDGAAAPFSRVVLPHVPEPEQASAIEAAAAQWQASLNFTEGPLLRVVWFDLGENRPGRLLFIIHHLAVDAISWRILLEDLETAYRQLCRKEPVQLPAKTTSFKQWAEFLNGYGQSEAVLAEADYWLAERRSKVTPLPVDYPAGHNTVASTSTLTLFLSEEETRALLQDVPKAFGTQINDVLLTALGQTFARWNGDGRLLVDLEGHGREPIFDEVDLSRTVGWFTPIYPVLLDLTATPEPRRDALRSIHEQLLPVRHGGIGYGVLRYLRADREIHDKLRALPQAEINFLYLGQSAQAMPDASPFRPAKESSGPVISPNAMRSYLFEVISSVSGGQLQVNWDFSNNLHRVETIKVLADGFMETLRSLIGDAHADDDRTLNPPSLSAFGWNQEDVNDIMAEIRKSTGVI
jgi:non-ribosomal peptide synthase protein (TIGR01720 family)